MPYIPHTESDVKKMLDTIGVDSIAQLFDEIPSHLQTKSLDNVPEGISEMEAMRLLSDHAQKDSGKLCFIGAGAYEHHIPAAVWDLTTRGEFLTAYTPYQAEASQGTLQVIYEFQSMMAHLTGLAVSNASLYDGGSALAEAALMAVRANRKSKSKRILMPTSVNPAYRCATNNIVGNQGLDITEMGFDSASGLIDQNQLEAFNGEDFAALVIQQPNFFGHLEDVHTLTNWAHSQGLLVIAVVNPTSLALLTPPGEWGDKGADICVGEGQPLGIPMASGGPYFGFMCCQKSIVRQMPGRIIGRTIDQEGKPGFTLTLQAREQHIRRSKATSNICTNQGLAVTAATIYMSLLGAEGLSRVAQQCYHNTHSMIEKLTAIEGVECTFNSHCFHEVVLTLPKAADWVLHQLSEQDIQAGIALHSSYPDLADNRAILLCATETKTEQDIDRLATALAAALA